MTKADLQKHYQIETEYAEKIKKTAKNSMERRELLRAGYEEIMKIIDDYDADGGFTAHGDFLFKMIKPYLLPNTKVLDFGCGNGQLVEKLASIGADAYGFDISLINAQKAQKKLEKYNKANNITQGEINNIQGSYDIIVMDNVIEHILSDEIDEVLQKCHSLLNDNGLIIILTPHRFAGPHDISKYFLPLGTKSSGFHFKEYTVRELDFLVRKNKYTDVMSYFFHPKILNVLKILSKPSEFSLKKSIMFEKIFEAKPFKGLTRINRTLSRVLTGIFFPTVIIARKAKD